MKLQVALDTMKPEEILLYLKEAGAYIDIAELGTPFVLRYGIGIIPEMKEIAPNVEILCDSKIMDAGYFEAQELFEGGADYVTVLAVTEDSTLRDCVRAARAYGKKAVADLICVQDLTKRVQELDAMGMDVIAVHTGVDEQAQGRTPLEDLRRIRALSPRAKAAVAGGISSATLPLYAALQPDIVIVGGGICKAGSPAQETRRLYEALQKGQHIGGGKE